MQLDLIFGILVLIGSVVLHEVSHGYMANALGDATARLAGRLTLNPLKHIDLMGSILVPAILVLLKSSILIGWAKPVPYNPYNIQMKNGEALVAAAGPLANILIALIFGLFARFGGVDAGSTLGVALSVVISTNLMLALFNLVPLPPLDGSKILPALLPHTLRRAFLRFRTQFGHAGFLPSLLIIMVVWWIASPVLFSALSWFFTLLTGWGTV